MPLPLPPPLVDQLLVAGNEVIVPASAYSAPQLVGLANTAKTNNAHLTVTALWSLTPPEIQAISSQGSGHVTFELTR
jgi:hypothetical protein